MFLLTVTTNNRHYLPISKTCVSVLFVSTKQKESHNYLAISSLIPAKNFINVLNVPTVQAKTQATFAITELIPVKSLTNALNVPLVQAESHI